jgi:hypothetical protein
MNEQLLSELKARSSTTRTEYFDGRGNVTSTSFDHRKFAELIIWECARAVDKVYEDAEPDHGCYDWATWAQGADVLKHFGVEE